MGYDSEIIKIMVEAGQKGLSVQKIAMHVYNACNSFFNVIDPDDVHQYVAQYLAKNSKRNDSFIQRTEKRGVYRLNPQSEETAQQMLQFGENEEVKEKKNDQDLSLSLF